MTIAHTLMQQLDSANVLFNVRTESLLSESGLRVPNKRVIINDQTNQPVSVVSDSYKIVTNEEIFDHFTKSIEQSGINTDDASVNVKQTPTGSRTMVDFSVIRGCLTVW